MSQTTFFVPYRGPRPLRRYRPRMADTRLPPLRGLNRRPRNAPLSVEPAPPPLPAFPLVLRLSLIHIFSRPRECSKCAFKVLLLEQESLPPPRRFAPPLRGRGIAKSVIQKSYFLSFTASLLGWYQMWDQDRPLCLLRGERLFQDSTRKFKPGDTHGDHQDECV